MDKKQQQTLFSSASEEWETPQDLFDKLNEHFHFTLDPCATSENAKCKKFYTKETDGLTSSWKGEVVFMNPPYGKDITRWVSKADNSTSAFGGAKIVVGLLPSRTDTKWFHDHCLGKAMLYFVKGRIKFGGSKNSAPFPSLICVWYDIRSLHPAPSIQPFTL